MKTLIQYLNEKLIINKDYTGLGNDYEEFDDRIVDIIKELLDNPEDEDIKFSASIIPMINPPETIAGRMGTKTSPNVLISLLIGFCFL